jgi:hypothetical protein
MSIQLAPNASAARTANPAIVPRPAVPSAPRVLQSARAPAQLSFFFKGR